MAKITIPRDFKDFLKSLNANRVEYLLVGGYAVGIHGYVRATNDLDVWVRIDPTNAARLEQAVRDFGFAVPGLSAALFLDPRRIVRFGHPPMRLEIQMSIDGVSFEECYAERDTFDMDGEIVPLINLRRLRQNKRAAGRPKDIADLQGLPATEPDTRGSA